MDGIQNSWAKTTWKFVCAVIVSSLVATIGGLIFLTILGVLGDSKFSISIIDSFYKVWPPLLRIILPIAPLVIFLFVVPVIILLRNLHLTKIKYYILVFICVIGICYLLLGSGFLTQNSATNFIELLIVPAAAIPAGFIFHFLVEKHSIKKPNRLLVTVAIIWIVTLFVFGFSFLWQDGPSPFFGRHWLHEYHPLKKKMLVASSWSVTGFLYFSILGFFAFSFVFITQRIATISFLISLSIPVGVFAWYLSIPRGSEAIVFQVGERKFSIDWKLEPRFDNEVLYFNAKNTGPYTITGSGVLNSNLAIGLISEPLANNISLYDIQGEFSPNYSGLECKEEKTLDKKMLRLCITRNGNEQITSLISCRRSFCFHQFDHKKLRISLHYNEDDWKKWREVERLSIKLLDDKTMIR